MSRPAVPPSVLFLTESFHPTLGGGETHIRAIASRLAAIGWGMTVVTRQAEPSWPRLEEIDGIRVVRVGPAGPARTHKYLMVPAALRAVHRLRSDYDVLVVRGTRVLGLPGLVAARTAGRPVVLQAEVNGEMSGEVYTWGTRWDHGPARRLVAGAVWVRNRLVLDADRFVAMSREIQREFLQAGIAPDRALYLPHGVDTTRFREVPAEARTELRRSLGLPPDGFVIVYTGRLLRGKGLETLIDAFAALPGFPHLVLVGSGAGQALSVEEDLVRQARAAGIAGRVRFTGRVDDVFRWLQAADLFAFPSVFEALGLSLLEAGACGLAAAATRTGGIVDVVEDGRSGLLVPPGDGDALRGALQELMSNPGRRAAMGRRAAQLVREQFDLETNVGRYRALFAELSSRPSGSQRGRAPRADGARRR